MGSNLSPTGIFSILLKTLNMGDQLLDGLVVMVTGGRVACNNGGSVDLTPQAEDFWPTSRVASSLMDGVRLAELSQVRGEKYGHDILFLTQSSKYP